jgi:heat shock protein HslJ
MTRLFKFRYFAALFSIATVLVACAPLVRSPAPTSVVVVDPASADPMQVSPKALAVSAWVAVEIDGIGPTQEPRPSLNFVSATQVVGSGGCNGFKGVVTFGETENLKLTALSPTGSTCLGTPGGQEDLFFKALERTRQARLEARELLLLDVNGKTLAQMRMAD